MAFLGTYHKTAPCLTHSVLGHKLRNQWRPFEDWGKLGCTAFSCGGQWFKASKWNETWRCLDCELYFHKGCQQQPEEMAEGYDGYRCCRCEVMREEWHKEWELQQPPPPKVVAAVAIPDTAGEKKRRGPIALARSHVHQMYKLRCCAATRPASLLAAGANGRAATPPARRN